MRYHTFYAAPIFLRGLFSKFALMITASFLTSVEFYVIAAVVAAAVIGYSVSPGAKGESRKYLLAGTLCKVIDTPVAAPALKVTCLDNGDVLLTRSGISGVDDRGAVSLAVTVSGFDINIEEKIVTSASGGEAIDTALFTFDFIGIERYHVHYNSPETGLFAAFTLNNRPGMQFSSPLSR